jgi:HSP20 family protein
MIRFFLQGKPKALFPLGKGGRKMNSLVRWRPMEELIPRSFFRSFWDEEVWDVFENLFESRELAKYNWAPKVESYRQNGTYVIKADLPGVEAKDIHVELENGCLTLKGERKMDKKSKDKRVDRREVFYGSFERSMAVPENLKAEEIKAKYHDGVLEITIPVEEKAPPKKIEVEAVTH